MASPAISMAGRPTRGLIAAAALSLVAVFGALQPAPVVAQPRTVTLPDFADLADQVGPSVVNIRTTERARNNNLGGRGGQIDPNLEEFFRRFGIPLPNGRGPRGNDDDDEPRRRGVGSDRKSVV